MILLSMKLAASSSSSPTTSVVSWFPSTTVSRQLFLTGATLGPMMDGLHNQCLLRYNVAPIVVDLPVPLQQWWGWLLSPSFVSSTTITTTLTPSHLFASSWLVPPLLGITYILLGGILPRIIQNIITMVRENVAATSIATTTTTAATTTTTATITNPSSSRTTSTWVLGVKAVLAVLSTAIIILISQYLILHPNESNYGIIDNTAVFESSDKLEQHLLILMTAAITQWAYLDGTLVAFVTASLTSVLGPLAELPFVAHDIWEYLPEAGDLYVPYQTIAPTSLPGQVLQGILGPDYASLTLNGVTAPCYFAVTMDAIAIGRYLTSIDDDVAAKQQQRHQNNNDMNDEIPENRLFIASSRSSEQSSLSADESSNGDIDPNDSTQ